jgi:tetratricopeptide (TPR) repeat protein
MELGGELTRVDELLAAVEHDPRVAALASLNRLEWRWLEASGELTEMIESMLPEMLEQLSRDGDERGLARAHNAAWMVHWAAIRTTEAAKEARLAAEYARTAGEEGLYAKYLDRYIAALASGPRHASEVARELDAIEREQPGPYLAAAVDRARAELFRLAGRFPDARVLLQRAIDGFSGLGVGSNRAVLSISLARIEFSADNPAGALRALQRGDAMLAESGEVGYRCTVQAFLAEAHQVLNHGDEARAALALSAQLSTAEDVVNFMITHRVQACLAWADGDRDAAEAWARSAVRIAQRTDWVWEKGRTRLILAHILSARGRREEAAVEAQAALDQYEMKGDQPGAALARLRLAEIRATDE